MSSNQVEIKSMLSSLKIMGEKLGGGNSRRALAGSQFDFIQQQFLSKRHEVQKFQDIKEKEGVTTKTADVSYRIREGINELKDLLNKLRSQYDRLERKKKDSPAVLASKKKIVNNCEKLYKDIEDRYNGSDDPTGPKKPYQTLTDMKSKLLSEIDTANANINHHQNTGSEDLLDEINEQEQQAMEAYRKKDEQMDIKIDEITGVIQNVRKGVKNINEKQDQINKKVEAENKQIGKMGKRIEKDNDKLKVIIEKFNSTRCCLVAFLMLLFIGLVVVIIKFLIPSEPEPEPAKRFL